MARTKERVKISHQPSTQEVFVCLGDMPMYSNVLLNNTSTKPYTEFLKWLFEINFYREINERTSVKKLATGFKTDSTKVTKWIHQIYADIFELNEQEPDLFQTGNCNVTLWVKYYDDACIFHTSMPFIPREFEKVDFYFLTSKVGTNRFWVKEVSHSIGEGAMNTTIRLEGGFLNRYREFALDKAIFHQKIGFMDRHDKASFEIDKELRYLYK